MIAIVTSEMQRFLQVVKENNWQLEMIENYEGLLDASKSRAVTIDELGKYKRQEVVLIVPRPSHFSFTMYIVRFS